MTKLFTGVGAVLSAAHRDRETGAVHGHTWEITAWSLAGRNAVRRKQQLERIIAKIDHTMLPDNLAWGEDLAAWIADQLIIAGEAPVQVDVARPAERLYARWIA